MDKEKISRAIDKAIEEASLKHSLTSKEVLKIIKEDLEKKEVRC